VGGRGGGYSGGGDGGGGGGMPLVSQTTTHTLTRDIAVRYHW